MPGEVSFFILIAAFISSVGIGCSFSLLNFILVGVDVTSSGVSEFRNSSSIFSKGIPGRGGLVLAAKALFFSKLC